MFGFIGHFVSRGMLQAIGALVVYAIVLTWLVKYVWLTSSVRARMAMLSPAAKGTTTPAAPPAAPAAPAAQPKNPATASGNPKP